MSSPKGAVFNIENNMKIVEYLKDTRSELKHVSWPTRSQAIAFSAIVIILSLAVAAFLGFFDFIFAQIISRFFI